MNINISTNKDIIIKPRTTEKSVILKEEGVYVFEVTSDANKSEVKKEIHRLYKVNPVKVNIAQNPAKKVFVRGRLGKKGGVKKAYVYLKKGDKINL